MDGQKVKVGIVSRSNEKMKWGGDLKALQVIRDGMRDLGHQAEILSDVSKVADHDHIFLSSTFFDLRPSCTYLKLIGRSYGVIAFHDDYLKYCGPCTGMVRYVRGCLNKEEELGVPFQIERLFENPHLIYYFASPPKKSALINYNTLKEAIVCIANSPSEAQTIQRDCPPCNVKTVFWTPGFADVDEEPTEEFLKFTGLKSGEYILQVGRFHDKKNHLSTILATKDLDAPLVFIATTAAEFEYERICLMAANAYRKAPTIVVSQKFPTMVSDRVKILHMPGGRKLSSSMLLSAIFHAGLHLHPAFYELPGYTYLESTKLGVATIASSWTTIADYFGDRPNLDGRIAYALPYDLNRLSKLAEKMMGKRFLRNLSHPIFQRKPADVAREILSHL